MPDSWNITGNLGWGVAAPGPTTLDLASYTIAAEGIDFDFGALFKDTYAQNSIAEGGALAFDESNIRQFHFPLRLASAWSGPGGVNGLENFLRQLVRKPAHPSAGYIDLLPQNATTAIRFDILDGRLSPRAYSPFMQRAARRDADLVLDVKPFGYMPTKILLASAAAASGIAFSLSWNQGSVIGDVPGLAEVAMLGSLGPSSLGANPQWVDGYYWSLSRAAGGTVFWSPSMIYAATAGQVATAILGATHRTDVFGPQGMRLDIEWSPTSMGSNANTNGLAGFQPFACFRLNDAPAYRGRFRLLAFMRTEPSHGIPWQIIADQALANAGGDISTPLGSHNPVATLISQGSGSYSSFPSGYQLLDLGEHSIPPAAGSGGGASTITTVRLWAGTATTNMGIASPVLECGGVAVLPVGGDAGVVPMGAVWPSVGNWTRTLAPQFVADSINRRMFLGGFAAGAPYNSPANQVGDARIVHFGDFPVISTAQSFDVVAFSRVVIATSYDIKFHGGTFGIGGSVSYRPRFAFTRGFLG